MPAPIGKHSSHKNCCGYTEKVHKNYSTPANIPFSFAGFLGEQWQIIVLALAAHQLVQASLKASAIANLAATLRSSTRAE